MSKKKKISFVSKLANLDFQLRNVEGHVSYRVVGLCSKSYVAKVVCICRQVDVQLLWLLEGYYALK